MISVNNLSFGYSSKFLFEDLNLSFVNGKVYGLLGKNGAGKTTLLKLICGLIFPGNGECKINGIETKTRNPEVLKEIFFIPEAFFVPALTIDQYLRRYASLYDKFDKDFFYSKLKELDLPVKNPLNKFSYGQKKKFLLLFGLATKSKLFIFDEPTNGLDIPTQSDLKKLLLQNLNEDTIFIISTHHVREFENIFDFITILDNGKILLNYNYEQLSSQLSVKLITDIKDAQDVYYYEEVPGGYSALIKNNGEQSSKLDLEFLFNAVTKKPEILTKIFIK